MSIVTICIQYFPKWPYCIPAIYSAPWTLPTRNLHIMVHFSNDDDVAILREARVRLPFKVQHGQKSDIWGKMAHGVSLAIGRTVKPKSVRARLDGLERIFATMQSVARDAPNISGPLTEKETLLKEYFSKKQTYEEGGDERPVEEASASTPLATLSGGRSSSREVMGVEASTPTRRGVKKPKQAPISEAIMEQVSVERLAREEQLEAVKAMLQMEHEQF